jgi:anti-sigma regulatory factor (Ser/Thr protein kinase)
VTALSDVTARATLESLGALIESVRSAAKARIASPERRLDIELAVEEALVNVISYAYQGGPAGDVQVRCSVRDGRWLVIEIIDSGTPFDVLAAPPPDLTAPVEERRTGGLGIHFIKRLTDRAAYRREGGRNILELRVRLDRLKKYRQPEVVRPGKSNRRGI